jgi:hypothetical protein
MIRSTHNRLAATLVAALFIVALIVPPMHATAQSASSVDASDPSQEIVYIDGEAGNIRVLDLFQSGGPQVQWISPEADFREFALGDVNGDGDDEIVAVKGDNTEAKPSRLVIYDPVVASGEIDPNQKINGIPWVKLFDKSLPFKPLLVAAGNFDANVAGAEFLVGMEIPSGTVPEEPTKIFKMEIYKKSGPVLDGKTWELHRGNIFSEEQWQTPEVGDVIPGATDELGLVDTESGKLEIYRLDTGFERIYDLGDTKKPAKAVAFGNWDGGDANEVAAIREATGLDGLFILDWEAGDADFEEDYTEPFGPNPRDLAFANGNGDVGGRIDDELYILRNVPEGQNFERIISRNDGGDGAYEWSEDLEDNEWRVIFGVDIEGDGRDELGLAREDKIRIYPTPESSAGDAQNYGVTTNNRSVLAGNLDAVGFIAGPQFVVDKTAVEATSESGGTAQTSIKLKNGTTAEGLPYSISADGNPGWLTIDPASGSTPTGGGESVIQLKFDAADLLPGTYTSRLRIDSSANVLNKPVYVDVTFNVISAQVVAQPNAALFTSICTDTITGTVTMSGAIGVTLTQNILLTGTAGTNYTASILANPTIEAALAALDGKIVIASYDRSGSLLLGDGEGKSFALPSQFAMPAEVKMAQVAADWPSGVPWASASSDTTSLPSNISVTVVPSLTTSVVDDATLLVMADVRAGAPPNNLRLIPLYHMCVDTTAWLPSVRD